MRKGAKHMRLDKISKMVMAVAIVSTGYTFAQLPADISVGAGPKMGDDSLKLRPYIEAKGSQDSNFKETPTDEDSETYFDVLGGLQLSYAGPNLQLLVAGFGSSRMHSDYTDDDFETYGEGIRLIYGTRDTLKITVNQAYRNVTDNDAFGSEVAVGGVSPDSVLDTAASQERDIMQAAVVLGYNLSDKTDLDGSYRFDSVDYTDKTIQKVTSHTALFEIASKVTDKTSGVLALKTGIQDGDQIDESADFYSASLGLKTKGTDKLKLKATAGFQQYNRPGDLDSEESTVFDAMASLRASEKLSLQAGARNGTQLSSLFAGNGTEYSIFFAGARLAVSPSVKLSANVAYRQDDYLDPVTINGALVDRTDKGTSFSIRADYKTPSEYMNLFAQVVQQSIESDAGDYDQTLASLGVRLQY